MAFNTTEELKTFLDSAYASAQGYRNQLAMTVGRNECYFEGIQYIFNNGVDRFVSTTMGRLLSRWNPDSTALRVTSNHVTEKITVCAAATYPTSLDAEVKAPIRDEGIKGAVQSQTLEDLLSATVKHSNILSAAQDANIRRCVAGVYGIGLSIKTTQRPVNIGGQRTMMPSKELVAFDVHPTRFVLDPFIESRDLRQHNYVIYYDVWTIDKLRATYPEVKWNPDDMNTVGQLTPYEQSLATLSNSRLFEKYRTYSKTKGAIVYQLHRKDDTGRFGEYYIAVRTSREDLIWVNKDDSTSPFGGDGLPFVLLHGNRRANSMWSISDVSMIQDSQDMLNLTQTMLFRHLQAFTSPKYVVDSRFFGVKGSKEDWRNSFSNQVGGLIVGYPSADKTIMPPQLVNPPPPQPMLLDLAQRSADKMRTDTFRTEMNVGGGAKSHVPFQTTSTLLNEGDRVLSIRITEDTKAYEQILNVALGTQIKHVHDQSLGTLAMLDEEGFDQEDVARILQTDPLYPTCGVNLDESSVRYVSTDEKRQTLTAALTAQAITPSDYARAMAEYDMPITQEDRFMRTELEKSVDRLIQGEPWTPVPLGKYNDWCLSCLMRAQYDQRIRFNQDAKDRVAQAIQAQEQVAVQQALATNPEYQMQMQQAQMAQAQAAQQAAPTTDSVQKPITLQDVLTSVGG